MVTLADYITLNGLTGLAMIAGLFLGVGTLIYVMMTR
jgi:hypothetical protein